MAGGSLTVVQLVVRLVLTDEVPLLDARIVCIGLRLRLRLKRKVPESASHFRI